MNVPVKLAGFALGLVAVFGAAVGVGSAVGPVAPAPTDAAGHGMAAGAHDEPKDDGAADLPTGLMVTDGGYTLALDEDTLPASAATPVSFRILGRDGAPVTGYDESHDQDLHLIAVRRDLSGFQHVHPVLGGDGSWRIPLDLTPGVWRLFADFVPAADGEKRVLGADLSVPGDLRPVPLPDPSVTATVDGYTVTLSGTLVPGKESELTLAVARDGRPVTDLQPYLSAYGHLVVLRAGDLAYLHVHPTGEPGDGTTRPGPDVHFMTTAPSAGTYRLFLDFRHGSVMHTAAFTVATGEGSAS
jgi:hypothetical protein